MIVSNFEYFVYIVDIVEVFEASLYFCILTKLLLLCIEAQLNILKSHFNELYIVTNLIEHT